MSQVTQSLVSVFDFAHDRLEGRIEGLGDDEYLWEPAPGCWSVHRGPDGVAVVDGGPLDGPPPLTTIAWRTYHLAAQVLGGFTGWFRDGSSPRGTEADVPLDAASGGRLLSQSYADWHASLAGFDPGRWWGPLGEQFGPFAESSALDLALHVLDEYVHHAAEIALLRDLYRVRD